VKAALQRGFEDLISRPGWSNARDAISVWRDRILLVHARNTANLSEVTRNISVSDVEGGMGSYLSDRPKEETVSGEASQWDHNPHVRMRQSMSNLNPEVYNRLLNQATTNNLLDAESSLVDDLSEDEIRRIREEEEVARKQEEDRLTELREAEERLRQEILALEERERLAREQQQREVEEDSQRQREEAERKRQEAQECARKIEEGRRLQQRIQQIGICPGTVFSYLLTASNH
jgi:hypothetical protein